VAYQTEVNGFAGPIDAVFGLVENNEMPFDSIFVNQVISEYIGYLDQVEQEPPDSLAETLCWLARLLALKAHRLVHPNDPIPAPVLEPDAPDDNTSSTRAAEYQFYLHLRMSLAERAESGLRSYLRLAPVPMPNQRLSEEKGSLSLLTEALRRALATSPRVTTPRDGPTLTERMGVLRRAMLAGTVNLANLFAQCVSRVELIVTFLALLELMRIGEALVRQERLFGDIMVEATPAHQENNGSSEINEDIGDTGGSPRS
jgi:segregation and condensation protein A